MGFGGKKTTAATPPRIQGMNFNSSVYGSAIPVIYGRARIPGKLIWSGNFQTVVTQQGGGKK